MKYILAVTEGTVFSRHIARPDSVRKKSRLHGPAASAVGTRAFLLGLISAIWWFYGGPSLVVLSVAIVILVPLELTFALHDGEIDRTSRFTDICHLVATPAITGLIVAVPLGWLPNLLGEVPRGADHIERLPIGLRFLVALVALDLLAYFSHRLLHMVPAFWAVHAVHHSSTQLNWLSWARQHPLNDAIAVLVAAIPAYLIGIDMHFVGIAGVALALWQAFIHANIEWSLRWLDGIIATPRFHHWHHAKDAAAIDKNFAPFLPLWDRIFGTYHQPAEYPDTYGIEDSVPIDYIGQLVTPTGRMLQALMPQKAKSVRVTEADDTNCGP